MKTLIFSFFIALFCSFFVYGQNDKQNKPDEPVLIPLTNDEKKINPKDIISNQPDFTATEVYFSAREISGFSASSKVARKGNKYRTDTGFVVVITEPKKSTLRLNQDKTYEESVGVRKPYVSPTSPLNPTDLLGFEDISFSALGTIDVNKNKLLKIQAKSKEFDEEVFLYADLSKKNLITIIQVLSPRRSSIQRLEEISFEVSDKLFDISDYKSLPKYKWNKVKTAKVFYDGALFAEGIVFRYDKYLFIYAGEFNTFLVDLEKKTSGVSFRGLLVAKDGSYIWRTNEDEATSSGGLDGYTKSDCKKCPKVEVSSNYVILPDPMYDYNKILVKVTW